MNMMDAKLADGMVVVVSAVNIRKGGTLTILRDCLGYLSGLLSADNQRYSSFCQDKDQSSGIEGAEQFCGQSGHTSDSHKSSNAPAAHPSSAPAAHPSNAPVARPSRVIALVHDRKLCDYPGIEYIEIPWTTKGWLRRLWCEYVTMYGISKRLAAELGRPVDLWLSMHDTTPRVIATKQEVYCQTSFPFLKRRLRDLWMDPKVFLFSLFTKFAYKVNIRKNSSIIVQQEWFRDAMAEMLHLPKGLFRVIPPAARPVPEVKGGGEGAESVADNSSVTAEVSMASSQSVPQFAGNAAASADGAKTFFYASTADCHKNFELLFEAARLLEAEIGADKFKVSVTISGNENRYARWLRKRWGNVASIDWAGFLSKDELFRRYKTADCFVFPSRIETWGLPVTEYMSVSDGPVLISDLPYAHETVASKRKASIGGEADYGGNEDASGRKAAAGTEADASEYETPEKQSMKPGIETDASEYEAASENRYVRFFNTDNAAELAKEMREVIESRELSAKCAR